MKTIVLLLATLLTGCSAPYLLRISENPKDIAYLGVPAGYVNSRGDTIVPIGKYLHCYTDTIRRFGVVAQQAKDRQNKHDVLIAINARGRKLYNVHLFDNGPDYPCQGLFRITNDRGLIGYADTTGRVVIRPQFEAAHYFSNGEASVARKATVVQDGEYSLWESDEWFVIDLKGRKIPQK